MFLIPKFIILKTVFPFLAFLVAWEVVWKIIAMYKAGQQKELWWFICIFIFNTFWLLPIIYLLVDSMKKDNIEKNNIEKDNIELSKENNNVSTETTQPKKALKGGVKKWENVMSEKKQKGMLSASSKTKQKSTQKEVKK